MIEIGTSVPHETPLFKYQTLSQFMSLVETGAMYISKITNWDDQWEAPMEQLPIINNDGTTRERNYNIRNDIYGQCWTLDGESDALWRIYSPNKEGILLKTTAQKFIKLRGIHGILDRVTYTDFTDIKDLPQDIFSSALLKRIAYKHEDEVRLLTILQGPEYRDIRNFTINIEINDFLEGIIIDPRASKWFVEMIIKYCERAGLSALVYQSDLYTSNVSKKLRAAIRYVSINDDQET